MAGFDLVMGIMDIAFLAGLLVLVSVYTGGAVSGKYQPYIALLHAHPLAVTGAFLMLFCLKNLAGVWQLKSQHQYVYGVAARLSDKRIKSYTNGNYIDFVNVDSSVRIREISHMPIEFGHYVLSNIQQITAQGILILFTITAILFYHPVLFVLLLLLMLPPVVLLGWGTKHQLKKVRTRIKAGSERVLQYLQESLAGFVESNIYQKQSFFTERYATEQRQMNRDLATQQTLQGLSSRFVEIFAVLGFFILLAINKLSGDSNTINVVTIGVFMGAAYKIIPGVVKILNSLGQIKTYSFTLNELSDKAEVLTVAEPYKHLSIYNIRFDNISFGYTGKSIISDLSFEIFPGDFVGMSSVSGRGKTTVVNLLLGFLNQNSGDIYINHKPVSANQRKAFWPAISYVKQQTFFINDTILKNITMSDDAPNEERLAQALYISGLGRLTQQYPEGLKKLIKEHGKNISGGQRQRIALARALYHDFDLLILDEPLSEMDDDAEQEILARIKNLCKDDKMVLLITHNRASLTYCNKTIQPELTYA